MFWRSAHQEFNENEFSDSLIHDKLAVSTLAPIILWDSGSSPSLWYLLHAPATVPTVSRATIPHIDVPSSRVWAT